MTSVDLWLVRSPSLLVLNHRKGLGGSNCTLAHLAVRDYVKSIWPTSRIPVFQVLTLVNGYLPRARTIPSISTNFIQLRTLR
jgi:hypothetical protein